MTHSSAPTRNRSARRLAACLALVLLVPVVAAAGDVLILQQTVSVRQLPLLSGKELAVVRAGESYEIARRPSGKPSRYILDDEGTLWMKIRLGEETTGYVRTDQVSVAREEFRSPRGTPLLLVNIRTTSDGETDRDLWLIEDGWRHTQRLAAIEGQPIWSGTGEWFLCQVESRQTVQDSSMDRRVELIERFSADGRTRSLLAAGFQPLLLPERSEIYFYRDVNEHGDPIPPGLFAMGTDGSGLRAVFPLPERFRFWKEDGDYYLQAPAPILQPQNRIALYAYFERNRTRYRYTLSVEGHLLELRRD